jgi:hypothetical protein
MIFAMQVGVLDGDRQLVCKAAISSGLKAASTPLCTVNAPMASSPAISGSAISERVSGRCGFLKKTASSPTS